MGRILESRIRSVIPFDGERFHKQQPSYTVRSAAATDDWIFGFDLETWRLESQMQKIATHKRNYMTEGGENGAELEVDSVSKRRKKDVQVLGFSPIVTIYTST